MNSIQKINLKEILFFDIETTPMRERWHELPENVKAEWKYKHKFADEFPKSSDMQDEFLSNQWDSKAALYPEFSKVVCIVAGFVHNNVFRYKQYSDQNEGKILSSFADDLNGFVIAIKDLKLSGHYVKGFDIPFVAKRLLINRMSVPDILDMSGKKPWEIPHICTRELWKFGGTDSASLSAIAMAFGLPSPKSDLDGSQVCGAYYRGEYQRIADYCAQDVITQFNVFLCMRGEQPFNELQIEKAE